MKTITGDLLVELAQALCDATEDGHISREALFDDAVKDMPPAQAALARVDLDNIFFDLCDTGRIVYHGHGLISMPAKKEEAHGNPC